MLRSFHLSNLLLTLLTIVLRRPYIHADDVIWRRGYCDHFVTVCVCVFVSTVEKPHPPLIEMT